MRLDFPAFLLPKMAMCILLAVGVEFNPSIAITVLSKRNLLLSRVNFKL
jgi:hypothetical protein